MKRNSGKDIIFRMIRINQIKISVNQKDTEKRLRKKAAELLHIKETEIRNLQIVRQSIDARKKPEIYYSYVVDVETAQEEKVCKRAHNNQISVIKPVTYRFPVAAENGVQGEKGIHGEKGIPEEKRPSYSRRTCADPSLNEAVRRGCS